MGTSRFYHEYLDHEDGNDVVPGTDIPRLRPVRLGERAMGFFSDEVDQLIEALRHHRNNTALEPRPEPAHLRIGREAYWKQERHRRANLKYNKAKREMAAQRREMVRRRAPLAKLPAGG
jgi:hypothetical protein